MYSTMIDDEVRRHACLHARRREDVPSLPVIKLTVGDSQLSPVGQQHKALKTEIIAEKIANKKFYNFTFSIFFVVLLHYCLNLVHDTSLVMVLFFIGNR